ncbi:hypothetical protein C0995_010523, partial [Termitomyces sp. Mi166
MPSLTPALSAELQLKIISFLSPHLSSPHSYSHSPSFFPLPLHTISTLCALCLTSKSLAREAKVHLYTSLYFTSSHQAHLACQILVSNACLGGLVKGFWFSDERSRSLPLLQQFDGTLMVTHHILMLGAPLTHLQAMVKDGVHAYGEVQAAQCVLRFTRKLRSAGKTLKALSVLKMPEGAIQG